MQKTTQEFLQECKIRRKNIKVMKDDKMKKGRLNLQIQVDSLKKKKGYENREASYGS